MKKEKKQNKEKKSFPVLPTILGGLILLAAAAYTAGFVYYQNHFLDGTVVDDIDVSKMTIGELKGQMEQYLLQVTERKTDGSTLEEEIQGKEIDLTYSSVEPLEEFLQEQNTWLWFLPQRAEHRTEGLVSYSEEKLEERVQNLQGFQKEFATSPTDAYISEYSKENGYELIPETQGNELEPAKTLETIQEAIQGLAERIDLDEAGCYKTPKVTSEDEQLLKALEQLKKYADIEITYTFGERQEIIDGALLSEWLSVEGAKVILDKTKVEAYVAELRKKYDTIFRNRTFMTSYGKEVTIVGGDYGWWMDYEQEAIELAEMIENGESGERTPVYFQTAASYETPDYGNTYVEINLTAQHLFLYKDGEKILESDFVSGNASRGYDTPAGAYSITYKQRDATLTGENYRTPVSYWMPFNRNIGMHDANWRGSFGGNIYKTNGSHGCINLPPSKAKTIYETIEKGTAVICYHLPGTEPVVKIQDKGEPTEQPAEGTPSPEQPVEATAPETPATPPPEAPVE